MLKSPRNFSFIHFIRFIHPTSENVQEVANDDSLDDLFPDGLADTAIHDLPVDPAQSTAPLGPESPGEDEDSEDSQELPVA